ncbi:MAG: hypothetical protein ACKVRO_13410 [Micropepsaceae bacterium]
MLRPLALLFFAATTAFAAYAEAVPGVSGRWYMEKGTYFQYLVDRSEDGTFSASIRLPKDCSAEAADGWIETGRWSYRDGTLYNETQTVRGEKADTSKDYYRDSFKVTIIDDDRVTTYDNKTKETHEVRRVGADFKFPMKADCAV